MMVATMSFVFTSCGDDNDDDTPYYIGEWVSCNSKGEFAEEDGSNLDFVEHFVFRQNGTGENWIVEDGEKKEITIFIYTLYFDGTDITKGSLYAAITSEHEASLDDTVITRKFDYKDGILILHTEEGDLYYKKK